MELVLAGNLFSGDRPMTERRLTRSQRRCLVVLAITGAWLVYAAATGSLISGFALLLTLMLVILAFLMTARMLGLSADHPMLRSLSARPWRDGQDVLQLALRDLKRHFIVMPRGSLFAPGALELRMNPADLESLAAVIELEIATAFAVDAYAAAITANKARVLPDLPVDVALAADRELARGRYRFRHCQATARPMAATLLDQSSALDLRQNPLLRIVTGSSVAETRMSGARAGRAGEAELMLPDEASVSRMHARFRCSGRDWWITALGRNGIVLNGEVLAGEQLLHHCDSIRWGRHPEALSSQIEILSEH
jgi:hypothetical protein